MSTRLMTKRSALRRMSALAALTRPSYVRPIGDAGQLATAVTMRYTMADAPQSASIRFSSVIGKQGRRHRLLWINGTGPYRVGAYVASQVLTGMSDVEVVLNGVLWRITLRDATLRDGWREETLWPLMGRFGYDWPAFPSENHIPLTTEG